MVNIKKKLKRERDRKRGRQSSALVDHWMDVDGMHFAGIGASPTPEDYEKMTREYQAQIRNSPLFDQWVKEFGKEKAEEMLKECVAKPG